jgi:hypothetical protein
MVSVRYSLDVDVDEHSGEDGASAPSVSLTDLFEFPTVSHLPLGRRFENYVFEPDKGILKKAAAVVAVRIMNPLDFIVEQGL